METWKGNNAIFRTYCRGVNKGCGESHKGKNVRSWSESESLWEFGGILQPNFIDVSLDDPEMSEAFLNMAKEKHWRCMVLKNPQNGHIHTFWKIPDGWKHRDGENIKLACGLVADIHHKETYIPLRVNGVDRFPPVYDTKAGEDYQELPVELSPVKTETNLWRMKEGDGRNSELFSYILTLQQQLGMDPDAIRNMYETIINPFILLDPLPDDELDTVLRDESFQQTPEFTAAGKFRQDIMGDYLIQNNHIVMLNGTLHSYQNGIYTPDVRGIKRDMYHLLPVINTNNVKNVFSYLESMAPEVDAEPPDFIAFRNGLLNIHSGELVPLDPEHIITNLIPWDYVPDAYSAAADDALNKFSDGDASVRKVLEECTGYCFIRSCEFKKAFILTGEKNNGKSTFLKMLQAAIGQQNYSVLDLKQLGDRFSTASLYGKLANIGDDISDEFIVDASLFKKITSGDEIKAERKGKDEFSFRPYSTLLFSANDIPRMKDRTGAVVSRLEIIPFRRRFRVDDPDYDPHILKKLLSPESMQYLIRVGIEGLNRLEEQGQFTKSAAVQDEVEAYQRENNPILAFIDDQGGRDAIIGRQTVEVFKTYCVFCEQNGFKECSNVVFTKQLNREAGMKVMLSHSGTGTNRKTVRVFVSE